MKSISSPEEQAGRMARKMTTREIETTVGKLGNGAHVYVPKDWIGKTVRVTLLDKVEVEKEE